MEERLIELQLLAFNFASLKRKIIEVKDRKKAKKKSSSACSISNVHQIWACLSHHSPTSALLTTLRGCDVLSSRWFEWKLLHKVHGLTRLEKHRRVQPPSTAIDPEGFQVDYHVIHSKCNSNFIRATYEKQELSTSLARFIHLCFQVILHCTVSSAVCGGDKLLIAKLQLHSPCVVTLIGPSSWANNYTINTTIIYCPLHGLIVPSGQSNLGTEYIYI